ncbi:hypothetical protein VNO80_23049 [Phaseolus coccineus]|uniref:Uncharacterized protein n=1 Tax=Phaseolus coccineus TaxID=3886 RepID=A0AAN9M6Y8_PHACN
MKLGTGTDYVKIVNVIIDVKLKTNILFNFPSSAAARVAATKGPKPTIDYGMFLSSITCLVCLKLLQEAWMDLADFSPALALWEVVVLACVIGVEWNVCGATLLPTHLKHSYSYGQFLKLSVIL